MLQCMESYSYQRFTLLYVGLPPLSLEEEKASCSVAVSSQEKGEDKGDGPDAGLGRRKGASWAVCRRKESARWTGLLRLGPTGREEWAGAVEEGRSMWKGPDEACWAIFLYKKWYSLYYVRYK